MGYGLRVCLFGGKIWWMENFGEKMGMKTFLSMFGLVGRKENKLWGLGVFSPDPPKRSLSKMERKLKREIMHHFWTKMLMCNCTWVSSTFIFFKTFFFFFFSPGHCLAFPFLFTWTLPAPASSSSSSSSSFFFFFLGRAVQSFYFFVFFFWFRCDFFYGHDFYFLINLGN